MGFEQLAGAAVQLGNADHVALNLSGIGCLHGGIVAFNARLLNRLNVYVDLI